jgi:hypothetical protein
VGGGEGRDRERRDERGEASCEGAHRRGG